MYYNEHEQKQIINDMMVKGELGHYYKFNGRSFISFIDDMKVIGLEKIRINHVNYGMNHHSYSDKRVDTIEILLKFKNNNFENQKYLIEKVLEEFEFYNVGSLPRKFQTGFSKHHTGFYYVNVNPPTHFKDILIRVYYDGDDISFEESIIVKGE